MTSVFSFSVLGAFSLPFESHSSPSPPCTAPWEVHMSGFLLSLADETHLQEWRDEEQKLRDHSRVLQAGSLWAGHIP